jgi:hypothetical protein
MTATSTMALNGMPITPVRARRDHSRGTAFTTLQLLKEGRFDAVSGAKPLQTKDFW